MTGWRDAYRAEMKAIVMRDGKPMKAEEGHYGLDISYYSWVDYRALEHFRACGLADVSDDATITEEWGDQFVDTFYTGDTRVGFVVLHPVVCTCAKYSDTYWAVESTWSDLVNSLLGPDKK
jgi:hypothetical protein